MGMLIDGRWVDNADRVIANGRFVREDSQFNQALSANLIATLQETPGRYCLVASYSCPWSHRVLLVHALKQLGSILPVAIAGGPRIEGYALSDSTAAVLDTTCRISHVHQLYSLSASRYTGRATVPLLWDTARQHLISNDSGRLMRGLDAVTGPVVFTLAPGPLRADIDTLNQRIYHGLANAVYQAGLAQRQTAYQAAVTAVFNTLDWLEQRLGQQRYLCGSILTEADWRLFATLVRFDAVYATHFRCTRRRLIDYPQLWGYARDLWGWRGVAQTVDMAAILDGYYANDGSHNPHRIVAEAPDVDWSTPHERAGLGPAQLWFIAAGPVTVDPITLEPNSG